MSFSSGARDLPMTEAKQNPELRHWWQHPSAGVGVRAETPHSGTRTPCWRQGSNMEDRGLVLQGRKQHRDLQPATCNSPARSLSRGVCPLLARGLFT